MPVVIFQSSIFPSHPQSCWFACDHSFGLACQSPAALRWSVQDWNRSIIIPLVARRAPEETCVPKLCTRVTDCSTSTSRGADSRNTSGQSGLTCLPLACGHIAHPLQLPPSPPHLWLLCKYKVPFPSRLNLTWEGLPKVVFYLRFYPPPSAGASGLHREQRLLPPAPSASPCCDTEPGLCPSPGHQHHLPRLRARTPRGCSASLGWKVKDSLITWRSPIETCGQHGLIASAWGGGGGGRKLMLLHLNVSQMLTHSHFQAENLAVVFSFFYLYRRLWIHHPACPIF